MISKTFSKDARSGLREVSQVCYGLIKKIRLFSEFVASQPGRQAIAIQMLPNISRSKGDKTVKYGQLQELFFKNKQKCPDFGEKGPDSAHLTFSIQNIVLRVSRWKNFTKNFLKLFAFSPVFLKKCLSTLVPQNFPYPEK